MLIRYDIPIKEINKFIFNFIEFLKQQLIEFLLN